MELGTLVCPKKPHAHVVEAKGHNEAEEEKPFILIVIDVMEPECLSHISMQVVGLVEAEVTKL